MENTKGRKRVKPNELETPELPKKVLVNFINNREASLGVYELPLTAGP